MGFLPARRYASLSNSDHKTNVCLSVYHEPVLCQNEDRYGSVMISLPSGSPKILVF